MFVVKQRIQILIVAIVYKLSCYFGDEKEDLYVKIKANHQHGEKTPVHFRVAGKVQYNDILGQ